jgi:hypothetical protein
MPKLEAFFHYRNLDVSTLKELAKRWAPQVYKSFKKKQRHTALADVYESIDELKHYREHFLTLPLRTVAAQFLQRPVPAHDCNSHSVCADSYAFDSTVAFIQGLRRPTFLFGWSQAFIDVCAFGLVIRTFFELGNHVGLGTASKIHFQIQMGGS